MPQACELVQRLRALPIGGEVVVPGKTARDVGRFVCTAKVGHRDKFFETRNVTTGARIRRLE